MAEKKLFTRREVEKSSDKDKVLIIIHDKVFNVHSFLNEHPGGEEILLDHKGKDSSEDFDDVGHSNDAMDLMKKYQVGKLVDAERSNKPQKKGWVSGYMKQSGKTTDESGRSLYLIMGAIVLIVGLFFYAY
jgi:cytochrome b5